MSGSNSLLDSIAHPTTLDPDLMDAYGKGAQIANSINRNRLFQSQQAAGNAFLQSIKPDGSQDVPGLALGLQRNPNTALAAQGVLGASQDQAKKEFDLHQQRLTGLNAAAMALTAQYPNGVPQDAVNKEIDRVAPIYGLSAADIAQAKGSFGADPVANSRTLIRNSITNLNAQDALHAALPKPTDQNLGGTTRTTDANPITNPPNSGQPGAIGNSGTITATPAEKGTPTTGPAGPRGETTSISRSEYMRSRGLDPDTGNPIAHPAFKDLPSTLRNPNAPPPAAIPPTPTGVGPADTQAMSDTGGSSSKAYQATSDAGVKAVAQRAQLQGMAGDATQFTTGPGATGIKNLKATIQRVGGIFGLSPVDADKLAANEDLDKVAAQLADAQGAGSDARLAVNQGANPSSHNTPAGLKLILNKLIGNTDYLSARAQLAEQYQRTQDPTSANVRTFEAKVGKELDPRVFQFHRLDADQQKQYLAEMPSQAARDQFKRDYLRTKGMGVLPGG